MLDLSQLHLLRPWWLLALVPVLCLAWWFRQRESPVQQATAGVSEQLLPYLIVPGGALHWFNPRVLSSVLALVLVLVLAGPSWQRQATPFSEDLSVVVLALDLSASMQQEDVQPSRLQRAKQKIHDLLQLRAGARTALVAFAGSAHTVVPLSQDPDVLDNFLSGLHPDIMPRNGKAPERVLPELQRLLAEAPVAGSLVLITDGVGPASESHFSEYFSTSEHQLLILGMGTLGGEPLPLDRAGLTSLANASGGQYQDLTLDRQDVHHLHQLIEQHLVTSSEQDAPWLDAGYWLLYPAVFLFVLWFRRGWTLSFGLVLTVGLGAAPAPVQAAGFMDLWLTPDQQGRWYMQQGQPDEAARQFQDPLWRAQAFYQAGDFETAAELFARHQTLTGYLAQGNAWAHGRHYLRAVQVYDLALALAPGHPVATANRALVQEIIDDINRMSESQVPEGPDRSRPLGDEPERAEGALYESDEKQEPETLSAEQVLGDERIQALWMRQVQQDPAGFLALKFQMQLEQRDAP